MKIEKNNHEVHFSLVSFHLSVNMNILAEPGRKMFIFTLKKTIVNKQWYKIGQQEIWQTAKRVFTFELQSVSQHESVLS